MANQKIVHYNMDEIDKIGANYNLIWGERSNGKSYQVKHKKGVVKYLKTGRRFILMRRWKEEITTEKIDSYFNDVNVSELTEGKYNCITMYRKVLYLANYDISTGKTSRGEKIGYVVALSTEQNYAGGSYLDVDDIIFEEFMSRSTYIPKQGTIVTKEMDGEDGETITLAIEYCKSTGVSSNTFGKQAKMLNDGSWQTDNQPHLPKSINEYDRLFRIIFQFKGFKFIGELLNDGATQPWYIYPYEGIIDNNTLVISDEIRPSKLWQRDIYHVNIDNPVLQKYLSTFRESNIFYATDLCGTDFKQAIDFIILK